MKKNSHISNTKIILLWFMNCSQDYNAYIAVNNGARRLIANVSPIPIYNLLFKTIFLLCVSN